MSLFRSRSKKITISQPDPSYKVRYLGNVQTSSMKGPGCADKPAAVLWKNFTKSSGTAGMDMELTVCRSGLKGITTSQGITDYWASRISYCIAHPQYPRVFIWIYRHEGKKMKVELRCHAVLCKTEAKAKALAVQLHDKLTDALAEFVREKTRRQNTRLTLQRANSLPRDTDLLCKPLRGGVPIRRQLLNQGQNFRPPIQRSASAPKLLDIQEDHEPIADIIKEEDETELDDSTSTSKAVFFTAPEDGASSPNCTGDHSDDENDMNACDLEIGNDVNEFKQDTGVQYALSNADEEVGDNTSTESGFSEQEHRDTAYNLSCVSSYETNKNHSRKPVCDFTDNGISEQNIVTLKAKTADRVESDVIIIPL